MCEQDVTETVNIDIEIDNKNYFNYQSKTYFDNLDEINVTDEHYYISDRGKENVFRNHYILKDQLGQDIFKFIDGRLDKLYITVVKKKNNNHLYYLTTDEILSIKCSDCGKGRCSSSSYTCRGSHLETIKEMNSIYIGRNIEDVILEYNKNNKK